MIKLLLQLLVVVLLSLSFFWIGLGVGDLFWKLRK